VSEGITAVNKGVSNLNMKVRCFKVIEVNVKGIKFNALALVNEYHPEGSSVSLKLDLNDENAISNLISNELLGGGCDCVSVMGCNESGCMDILEYVSDRYSFKYVLFPKLSKLIKLGILKLTDINEKEVDTFYSSYLAVDWVDVPSDIYIYEGNVNTSNCINCLGLLLITEDGVRQLIFTESCKPLKKSTTRKVVRKSRRRKRRKSKKKR